MRRDVLVYLAVLVLFGGGIWLVLRHGGEWARGSSAAASGTATTAAVAEAGTAQKAENALGTLLLQVIVIVVAARWIGALFQRLRQPAVIGEMVAGILLGPSLLGLVEPGVHAFLFPESSLGPLRLLSQLGVILFMFVVGIELDVAHLRQRVAAAVLVSHASILVPFFLGAASAILLYPTLAPAGVPFGAFALFIGVAMSITAFPVLARILEERRLGGTPLGSTAIACAAVDDVTAWCLLALVVAIARASSVTVALSTVGFTLLFIAAMIFVVRPLAARLLAARRGGNDGSAGLLAAIVAFVFAAAWLTDRIGIHALFGAFLAGVCVPSGSGLREFLRLRLEAFGSVVLLPLFFAFTGLRTHVGLIDDWNGWLVCGAIVAVAIAGKLGGSMLAARSTGMGWGDAFSLGALMNTRGLVELIVLNVGYDLGILSPRIFTMLVLMALVTTIMTGPLLDLRHRLGRRAAA